jgi:hypothetical protein
MQLRDDYFAAYRSLKLTRDAGGVLVVEFHTKGGPFRFTAQGYTELVDAFYRIAQDRENKIVIPTGGRGEFIRPDGPEGPLKDLARSESYFRQCQLLSHPRKLVLPSNWRVRLLVVRALEYPRV